MNIAIVGSGHVGRALGNGWQKAGHSVTFAARFGAALIFLPLAATSHRGRRAKPSPRG